MWFETSGDLEAISWKSDKSELHPQSHVPCYQPLIISLKQRYTVQIITENTTKISADILLCNLAYWKFYENLINHHDNIFLLYFKLWCVTFYCIIGIIIE